MPTLKATRTPDASASSGRPAPRWLAPALAAILGALTIIAFFPAFSAGFVSWDDHDVLVNNPHYRGFAADNLRWMFTSTLLGHYQPLTWMSYAVDHALWGMNARGYHATNVAIHLVNVLLVFVLAMRLIVLSRSPIGPGGGEPGNAPTSGVVLAAGLSAGLWGLHPLRVESVAWITERRDVLSTLFLLLSTLAYLRSARIGELRVGDARWLWIAAGLLGVSLLCKAWGMTLFVMLLALDIFPLRRVAMDPRRWFGREGITLLVQKWPMVALGIAAAAMAAHAQHSAIATKTLAQWGVTERIVQAVHGLWFYMRTSVLPMDLSPLYALPKNVDPTEPRYLLAFVCVGVGAALIIALRHRLPGLAIAAAVYGIALLPVLGFLQSGDQFVADRYSYIAMIGFSILAGAGAAALGRRASTTAIRAVMLAAWAGVVGVLVMLTHVQTRVWDNTIALWSQAVRTAPSSLAHTNLALAYLNEQPPDRVKAAEQLILALRSDPDDGRAWFTLGNTLRSVGRLREAEEALLNAARLMPQAYMAHVNLGSMYLTQMNRPQDAIVQLRAAVADVERGAVVEKGQRRPLSALPYLALGNALRATGDIAGARQAFMEALKFDETRTDAENELRATPDGP